MSYKAVRPIMVSQITPLVYRDGITLLELINQLSDYVQKTLHPGLSEALDKLAADVTDQLSDAAEQYQLGVDEFERIHAAFMADVNAHLIALNDGAVTDLIADETSLLHKAIRDLISGDPAFTEVRKDFENHKDVVDLRLSTLNGKVDHNTSTINTTNQRLSTVTSLYPEHYGAIGDGKNDDTEAIQVWADNGGSTLKPGSTYLITETVTFNGNNRTVSGHGSKIINAGTSLSSKSFAITMNGDGASVNGVHIDGNMGQGVGGIRVNGEKSKITGCTVENFDAGFYCHGISVKTAKGGHHISDNVLRNLHAKGNGILGDANGAVRGILFTGDNDLTEWSTITTNNIENIVGEEGEGIHVLVHTTGVKRFGVALVNVTGNHISNCNRRGIKTQSGQTRVIENTITGSNTYHANRGPAIEVMSGSDMVINRNTINSGHHTYGIRYNGLAPDRGNYVTISDNVVRGRDGVESIRANTVIYTTISGNTMYGGSGGIALEDAIFSTISRNTLLTMTDSTATAYRATGDRVFISDNMTASPVAHVVASNTSTRGSSVGNREFR